MTGVQTCALPICKTAQAAHDKIMADTKAEQDQVIATAKEAIALEQKKAMDEVRAQAIDLINSLIF